MSNELYRQRLMSTTEAAGPIPSGARVAMGLGFSKPPAILAALAGGLLIGGAGVIELVAWRVKNPIMRIGFALFLIAVVGLIWVEGAVGVFS
jgi:hypothetical protein